VVLIGTDFTNIAWFVYFIHIVYNSVVATVVIVIRNGCYNNYFPQVILCLFFWNMDHEIESGKKFWTCTMSTGFSVGKLVLLIYDPWECKE
jgi:hypothetical protein